METSGHHKQLLEEEIHHPGPHALPGLLVPGLPKELPCSVQQVADLGEALHHHRGDESPRGVPRPPLLAVDHSPDVIAVGMSLHQKILEDPDPVDPRVDFWDLSPRPPGCPLLIMYNNQMFSCHVLSLEFNCRTMK